MCKVIIDTLTIPKNWKDILLANNFLDFEICGFDFIASPVIRENDINLFLKFFKLKADVEKVGYSNMYKMKIIRAKT